MSALLARSRSLSVFGVLLAGAMGLIASTQTWISVVIADGASAPLEVAGASAIAVLAPLSLAAMALGIALSIIGRVLRWVFAGLAVVIGAALTWLTLSIILGPPASAVTGAVTEATGIAGEDSIVSLIESMTLTAWPYVALACWIVLIGAGAFALATARSWKSSGKKYRTATAHAHTDGPLDAVDSWDDLSRGDDPTN